ncbi:hypothetical protein DFA_05648 [Cavenderia fasciculata]|uniref:Transmembrane protein n=1 Tax=Cavenderia fasciculata TaxID=261658 RepID=F4PLW1_CACFS|nr:uncharacterized protein DFA_05648 [Cavenderia fasciculata]EGG23515.1 hypothetical protein DFA_05648 [Cavenderia fasciculata]|eukprot:XP_004361366.1 hypothetical protein DFA_05648 [Cavenderia fasciculata]
MINNEVLVSTIKTAPKVVLEMLTKLSFSQKVLMGATTATFVSVGVASEILSPLGRKIESVDDYKQILDETNYRLSNLQSSEELNDLDFETLEDLSNTMANSKYFTLAMEDKIDTICSILLRFLLVVFQITQQVEAATQEEAQQIHYDYLNSITEHPFILSIRSMIDSIIKFSSRDTLFSEIIDYVGNISLLHIRFIYIDMIAKGVVIKGAKNLVDPLRVLEFLSVTGSLGTHFLGFDHIRHAVNMVANVVYDMGHIVKSNGDLVQIPEEVMEATKQMSGMRYRKYIPSRLYRNKESVVTDILVSSLVLCTGAAPLKSVLISSFLLTSKNSVCEDTYEKLNNPVGRVFFMAFLPAALMCSLVVTTKSIKSALAAASIAVSVFGVEWLAYKYGPKKFFSLCMMDLYSYDLARISRASQMDAEQQAQDDEVEQDEVAQVSREKGQAKIVEIIQEEDEQENEQEQQVEQDREQVEQKE